MNYDKLAEETRKLYEAFRSDIWSMDEAYELTKVCLREFPIFREMIEEEKTPEQIIGYVHFVDGHKDPVYKKEFDINTGSTTVYTKTDTFRMSEEKVDDPMYFLPKLRTVYYTLDDDKFWSRIYIIDYIEFI